MSVIISKIIFFDFPKAMQEMRQGRILKRKRARKHIRIHTNPINGREEFQKSFDLENWCTCYGAFLTEKDLLAKDWERF